MSFFKVRVFLCSHYRLTRCHNFQFEKHVCEILSRRFHYSSFSRVVSAHNEEVFSNKLSCVVEDDEKLTHIIEAEQFSFKSHASFCRSTATIIKLIRKPVKIAGFFPWHRAGNWLEWTTGSVVSYEKWCHIINYLLTSLARDRTGEYWPSVVFVRTSLRSVRTATTSGQYSPVRPLRSVSKRLFFFWICLFQECTQLNIHLCFQSKYDTIHGFKSATMNH